MKSFSAKKNYYCILGEGLFNLTGLDMLGLSSITPLFLSTYGASLGLIGMLTTAQGVAQAIMPLLSGGLAARAKSKRKVSLVGNGASRSLMLLIPASLLFGLPRGYEVIVFVCVFLLWVSIQPITGLVWNYLLNDCLSTLDRPKLLGANFTIAGIISLGTSSLIKAIRDSATLPDSMKYFYIFGLAAFFLSTSVLWFLPLRESGETAASAMAFRVKDYASALARCFKNKDYKKVIGANIFSNTSMVLNAFLYIYAANVLRLQTNLVSNLIILQIVGQIVGGIVTGQVSSRLGVKHMLMMSETAGLIVPLLEIFCTGMKNPYPAMGAAVFFFGFFRSGSMMGYSNYIIEVVEKDSLIFHMVTRGRLLLPVSFLSTAAGLFIQSHSMVPVFFVQSAVSAAAIFLCLRLRLVDRNRIEQTA